MSFSKMNACQKLELYSNHPIISENVHTARALTNDVILLHIFGFLKIEDLKHCRLVCHKWKTSSESSFKKNTRICFDFFTNFEIVKEFINKPYKTKEEFYLCPYLATLRLNDYFRETQGQHRIVALRLKGPLPWSQSELTYFFESEGRFIKDLTFDEICLKSSFVQDYNTVQTFSLTKLLGSSVIGNIKCLKILESSVFDKSYVSSHFTLCLEYLTKAEIVHLRGCAVELTDSIFLLAPKELTLHEVSFYHKSVFLKNVRVNDFVTFSAMNKLDLSSFKRTISQIELFVHEKVILKCLRVNRAKIRFDSNFAKSTSSWHIESLNVSFIRYNIEFNNLRVKEFSISHSDILDLRCLPQSVENLNVRWVTNIRHWSECPNINILDLHFPETIGLFLPRLKHSFRHLRVLKLTNFGVDEVSIDVNLIPDSLKEIYFTGASFDFIASRILTVEKMTLNAITMQFALEVTKHFPPRQLISNGLFFSNNNTTTEVHNENVTKLLSTSIPKITLEQFEIVYLNRVLQFQKDKRVVVIEIDGKYIFPLTPEKIQKIETLCSQVPVFCHFLIPNAAEVDWVKIKSQTHQLL